ADLTFSDHVLFLAFPPVVFAPLSKKPFVLSVPLLYCGTPLNKSRVSGAEKTCVPLGRLATTSLPLNIPVVPSGKTINSSPDKRFRPSFTSAGPPECAPFVPFAYCV